MTTSPVRYSCGDLEVVRSGEKLTAAEAVADGPMVPSSLGWRDDAGDHFVTFPTSTTELEAIEYVVPADPHADAVERVYDTSKGLSTADWRMTRQRVCRAQGGYNDAFARWMNGSSLDQVASELQLERRSDARDMVHKALISAQRRYYHDR